MSIWIHSRSPGAKFAACREFLLGQKPIGFCPIIPKDSCFFGMGRVLFVTFVTKSHLQSFDDQGKIERYTQR